jgi:hypothetical protein
VSKGLDCSTLHWRLRRLRRRPPVGACARRLALGRWHFLSLVKTVSTRTTRKSFLTHPLRAEATNSASLERRVLQGKRERTCAMLRITVHQNPESCTFQLEGRLAGAWVREVEECRRRILAGHRRPSVRFDLTDVTFIDADGRAYVAAMHRQGAQFVAADCLTRAIVAQITSGPIPDRRRPRRGGKSQTQLSRGATPRRTKRVAPDGSEQI